jgi:hypothetical protein
VRLTERAPGSEAEACRVLLGPLRHGLTGLVHAQIRVIVAVRLGLARARRFEADFEYFDWSPTSRGEAKAVGEAVSTPL